MREQLPASDETSEEEALGLRGGFQRLRKKVADLSRSRHAHAAMLGVSVVDGSVFPIPPFAILAPMVLAEPKRWVRYALTGTAASLVGGLIGYLLGFGALRLVQNEPGIGVQALGALAGAGLIVAMVRWIAGSRNAKHWGAGALLGAALGVVAILTLSELSTHLATPIAFAPLGIEEITIGAALTQNFWMLALLCSILPTPYKVVAIGSGFVGVALPQFMLASIIGRTVRFFVVSGAFALFGEGARRWFKF